LVPAQGTKDGAEIVANGGVVGRKRVRPVTKAERVLEPFQVAKARSLPLQRCDVVGPQRVAEVEIGKGLLDTAETVEKNRALVRRLPVLRVELECMLKAQDSLVRAFEGDQRVGKVAPEIGIVRFELDGLVENLQSFLASVLPREAGAETGQINRLRLAL